MLQVNPLVQDEVETRASTKSPVHGPTTSDAATAAVLQKASTVRLAPARKPSQPQFPASTRETTRDSQMRIPAFIGEVSFRGTLAIDGIISGNPGANGGSLNVRQHAKGSLGGHPELDGDLNFRDMLRVNGHIAGSVSSKKGTLIVDATAQIDADIEVAVAIIAGKINGDIIAYQRVELASSAKIHGNIWTRSLAIQNGAVFDGVCRMIEEKEEVRQ